MVADDTVWKNASLDINSERNLGGGFLDIAHWFEFAWNRRVNRPLAVPPGPQLNLGAGYREVPWAESLDREHDFDLENPGAWEAYRSGEIAGIWAHGVFEHIQDIPTLLKQCERVLMPRGVLNIVTPHGLSDLQAEDVDHKHPIVEDTWRNIFDNPYYKAGYAEGWQLRVHTCFILGVAWRNLALFTQLVKKG